MTPFVPQRRKAALVLFAVTLVWGATFIWMKQALNALEVEIETFGTFPVVAFLVALRFSIAMVLVLIAFPKTMAGLKSAPVWRGGGILGGLMLVGFVSQMVARQLSQHTGPPCSCRPSICASFPSQHSPSRQLGG